MRKTQLLIALAAVGFAGSAAATNGYFSHGYGMTAKGMAGAATAMTKDAFGGANNPATMVWVGNRIEGGVDAFSPVRSAERTGSGNGIDVPSHNSDNELFAIPEFGYNKMLNDKMSFGVTVYGNGGMNSDYSANKITSVAGSGLCFFFQTGGAGAGTANYNTLCGNGALGVDLTQLVVAPTFAYKVSEDSSIGVSPLIGYQRFSADGLQAFASMSSDANNLTGRGYDSSYGFGVRIGGYSKLNDKVSVGAAYATKVDMGKFDKYKGLFAEQGNFDMPANWNIGIAFQANPELTVALDYQHIAYGDVKAVANPSTNTGLLGSDGGRGFGWSDMDIVKLGVEYKYRPNMILRAGYSHTDSPIQARDVTFNILAPAVIEDHFTLGLTYQMDKESDLTFSYMHALENSVTGASLFTALGAGASGNETIKMHQNSLGVAYSKRF